MKRKEENEKMEKEEEKKNKNMPLYHWDLWRGEMKTFSINFRQIEIDTFDGYDA